MSEKYYIKPPITEAFIELRSGAVIDKKQRKIAVKTFSKAYDQRYTDRVFDVTVNRSGTVEPTVVAKSNDKFASKDMTEQLHIREKSLVFAQLAPYIGWSEFRKRIKVGWELWEKKIGFFSIQQMGMRYVNRIDIPQSEDGYRHADYVSVFPSFPSQLGKPNRHSINIQTNLEDLDANLNLSTGRAESPLPAHTAILVDIDVYKVFSEAPSREVVFETLDLFRVKKNEVFESCITDNARNLFRGG